MSRSPFLAIVFFSYLIAFPATGEERKPLTPFIHNSSIRVNPKNPSTVYASFWIFGVYKSTDYGESWRPVNRGLKNTSVYNLVIDLHEPETLYAGTHGGGVYKTTDGGKHWFEINTGLTTGTIWDMAYDPNRPQRLYALTSLGLFKTENGGRAWHLLPGGLPGPPPDQQITLYIFPSSSPVLFLQNGGNLYRWMGKGWSPPLLREMTTIRATPLASGSENGILYAAKNGSFLKSRDLGSTWEVLSQGVNLPTWMVLHPTDPKTLYIGTDGFGVFRSTDGGRVFHPVNEGIAGPTSLKIFNLAIDPKDGRRLYAASHSIGLFRTESGGVNWMPPKAFPVQSIKEVTAVTHQAVFSSQPSSTIPPPPDVFRVHCNKCHGWTDPVLGVDKMTAWRVAALPRDWTETVERMGALAGIDEEQKEVITAYLDTHFSP